MWIQCVKLSKKTIIFFIIIIILSFLFSFIILFRYLKIKNSENRFSSLQEESLNSELNNISDYEQSNIEKINNQSENKASEVHEEKSYIKWFEFKASYDVLNKTLQLDINSHTKNEAVQYNWIELISYLACKYGNNFDLFKQKDLDTLVSKLQNGETMKNLTANMKNYNYYYEGYEAVLSQFVGEYQVQKTITQNNMASNTTNSGTNNTVSNKSEETVSFIKTYGLKAFHPLAKNYSYSHYDDFGNSRSYGYKRLHFGNDLMGSIGTPVVAVESGIIEAAGWNQYGGWRVGIRSFDKKRYYYYAHLRKGHPFAEDIYEGKIVQAGDVIGYLGMTGYSTKEDVNNINVPHLHFGIQLIFNEIQKDGPSQIWVDVYHLIDLLRKNRSTVVLGNEQTRDYVRKYEFIDPVVPK